MSTHAQWPQMDSPADAIEAVRSRLRAVGNETVPLDAAAVRILAEDVVMDRASPPIDVSAMDGYAVRRPDLAATSPLPIAAVSVAGAEPPGMPAKGVVAVATGAGVPIGADAVVKRELVEERPHEILLTEDARATAPGTNIRRQGENAAPGQRALPAGSLLTPPAIGLLASVGVAQPTVRKRVRVTILTTGDEVLSTTASPEGWQLRDSNGPATSALVDALPWCQRLQTDRCPDDPAAIHDAIRRALEAGDVLVTTGGVSAGDRDFIPRALVDNGVDVIFHKVRQRPGRPLLVGLGPNSQLVLALPGNPVSACVTLRRIGYELLARRSGTQPPVAPLVRLSTNDGATCPLWWHRLVRLRTDGLAEPVVGRGSGDFVSLASSSGFVEIPPNQQGDGPWPLYLW